jgi:2-oxoglutarate dehydrogenase E1 component
MSGLVCLLPHGYEGQGPEHSSARLERYLQLCAEDNMQVVVCTTPANFFHALRRQLKREFRKPLIAMTPKSMLRNKRAISNLEAFGPGTSFHRLLWDHAETHKGEKIKLAKDDKIRRLLRVEQLYPFPIKALLKELSRFKKAEVVWCQEEPKNMGAWSFAEPYLEWVLGQLGGKSKRARYAGRPASAATATGLMSKHLAQLKAFVDECLA